MSAKPAPAHPKYEVMVAEAIKALKDRTGSSTQAIAKYIDGAYGKTLPDNWKKTLAVQVKRLAEAGKLVKVGLYVLSPSRLESRPVQQPSAHPRLTALWVLFLNLSHRPQLLGFPVCQRHPGNIGHPKFPR